MARPPRPEVRAALIRRAAELLARREPVTLRGLVAGTSVSTQAVYTYFDGMPGLWSAVRQEGFTVLADTLALIAPTADPVADVAAIGRTYVNSALADPRLYLAMFDGSVPLLDQRSADLTFEVMQTAVVRVVDEGRFRPGVDGIGLARQMWIATHGVCTLVCSGVLPEQAIAEILPPLVVNLCVAAGDDPAGAQRSFSRGWDRPDAEDSAS